MSPAIFQPSTSHPVLAMKLPRAFAPKLLAAFIVAISLNLSARGENWPQWRGANLDGISHETSLPLKWNTKDNVAWRLELPGPAGSTPAIWDDRIYLTSAEGSDLVLLAVSTDG